jgi:hypothetical protein
VRVQGSRPTGRRERVPHRHAQARRAGVVPSGDGSAV